MLRERESRPAGNRAAEDLTGSGSEISLGDLDAVAEHIDGAIVAVVEPIRVDQVDPDLAQPRRHVDPAALAELAASLDANGQTTAIMVRPAGDRYLIVAGERRWRAARSLGWTKVRAEICTDLDDTRVRWLQLAENVNRDDLSPVEEARAFQALITEGVSRDTLATRLGKTRSYVAQKLRLLDLPASLTLLLDRRALSEGHVRQLLRLRGVYTERHTVTPQLARWRDDAAPELEGEPRLAMAGVFMMALRPEDWPPGFRLTLAFDPDSTGDLLTADAMLALVADISTECPQWAVTATYFAAITALADLSVARLHTLVSGYIGRLHSAIFWVRSHPVEPSPDNALDWLHWWGHRADLRHAGLLHDHEHLIEAALNSVNANASVIAPSNCQSDGPQHEAWQDAVEQVGELTPVGGWSL